MPDVGVDRVGEVDRRRVARQRLHFAFRREDVDLFCVELDLQVLQELLRIADLLLPLEQLPQPEEMLLVAVGADAPFLVLPVRGDAFLRDLVHLGGADLDFERKAAFAHDGRVQRLVAVRPRHGDEVLDPPRHRRPRLVDDPERGVAIPDRLRHDPQRHEVVDLIEIDLLAFELLVDAEQALDAAVDGNHRNLRVGELGRDVLLQVFDHALVGLAPAFDAGAKGFERARLEVLERQFLELVLDLAHPEAVGDGTVYVSRLLRDLQPALLGQMMQRPHVVEPVGQLHQDHADVIDHGQQHLAEIFRLPLFARGELNRAELRDALDDMRDVGAEKLLDTLDWRLRVFDDVVEQPRGDGNDVELHVREEIGNLERMDEVRLPRVADLSLVLEGGEDVRPPQHLNIGLGVDRPDLFDEVLEPNHIRGV